MKNLKIWSLALALLVAMTGCGKDEKVEGEPFNPIATNQLQQKLQSAWQLVEYAGQPAEFDVYVEFKETENEGVKECQFVLYQRIYSYEYEKLTGTYTLNGTTLTGVYSNDVEWNNKYTVEIAENPLRLRLIEANGTYAEYDAIKEVPAHVEQAIEAVPTRASEYFL